MSRISTLAQHGSHGLGSSGALRDAAGVSAVVMIVLVALLCTSILIFALTLRHRSKNPSPESLLLDEVASDPTSNDPLTAKIGPGPDTTPRSEWEKPEDWWKMPPSQS